MPERSEAAFVTSDFRLRDMSREPSPHPCPDCGRIHLQGEHVQFRVPTPEPNGYRLVWEGCVDCWIKRTDPAQAEASGTAGDEHV